MQFRLVDLFKWMTITAVALAFGTWLVRGMLQVLHPRPRDIVGTLIVWGVIGGVVYVVARHLVKEKQQRWAVTGMGCGIVAGIFVGANSSLGLWAIETFNPNLPQQDFQVPFGVTVGVVAGAFLGALLGGIAGNLRRPQSP